MNYDGWMMLFSALSGIGTIIAVVVAIIISHRQKRIALFDRRVQILNDFERFVFDILPNWEWDGDSTLVSKYSKIEVKELFDESYGELQDTILKVAEECNILIGDIRHAERKGTCHGKDEFEIEDEKTTKEHALAEM